MVMPTGSMSSAALGQTPAMEAQREELSSEGSTLRDSQLTFSLVQDREASSRLRLTQLRCINRFR